MRSEPLLIVILIVLVMVVMQVDHTVIVPAMHVDVLMRSVGHMRVHVTERRQYKTDAQQ